MQKRIKPESIKIGDIIAVNTCDDGQLYKIKARHPDSKFVYELSYYYSESAELSGGFLDCGAFLTPSEAQWSQEFNQIFHKVK